MGPPKVMQRVALVPHRADLTGNGECLLRDRDCLIVAPELHVGLAEVAQRDPLTVPAADLALQPGASRRPGWHAPGRTNRAPAPRWRRPRARRLAPPGPAAPGPGTARPRLPPRPQCADTS